MVNLLFNLLSRLNLWSLYGQIAPQRTINQTVPYWTNSYAMIGTAQVLKYLTNTVASTWSCSNIETFIELIDILYTVTLTVPYSLSLSLCLCQFEEP